MKTVIGLAGVKTSGKSTVANIIKKHLDAKEVALANKLKDVSASVFGVSRDAFDRQDLKEVPLDEPRTLTLDSINMTLKGFNITLTETELQDMYKDVVGMTLETPRKIAQIIGTEILRKFGSDIHCENLDMDSDTLIVSDMRFPNEFEYFSKKSAQNELIFIPLYIQRNEAESFVTPDSHPSETSVFLFNKNCIPVDNNGSLEYTESQVLEILTNQGVLNGEGNVSARNS